MNKKLIVPIIALIVLLVKQFSGVEFTEAEFDLIVEGVLAIAVLAGVFMNPKK